MVLYIQDKHYTPGCRTGTLLAGVGLFASQIFISIVQHGNVWDGLGWCLLGVGRGITRAPFFS